MNTFPDLFVCVGVAFTSLGLSPSVSAQKRAITPPFAATSLLLWGKCNSQR